MRLLPLSKTLLLLYDSNSLFESSVKVLVQIHLLFKYFLIKSKFTFIEVKKYDSLDFFINLLRNIFHLEVQTFTNFNLYFYMYYKQFLDN